MVKSPGFIGSIICVAILLMALADVAPGAPQNDRDYRNVRNDLAEPFPVGLDSLTSLREALHRIVHCDDLAAVEGTRDRLIAAMDANVRTTRPSASGRCAGVLYVWSPAMPLSRLGVHEILAATNSLRISLALIGAASLYETAEHTDPSAADERHRWDRSAASAEDSLARAMIAAGATTHYPAILVYRDGRIVGHAIVGYKRAEAYESMIAARLRSDPQAQRRLMPDAGTALARVQGRPSGGGGDRMGSGGDGWSKDFEVGGRPGAYFRSVPGRNAVAFELQGGIYLLDLNDGVMSTAPGRVDFVPSPDGRLFVTPGHQGLNFFDGAMVFEAAADGDGSSVKPSFVDRAMRDQYPSVGVLSEHEHGGRTTVVYRVLTSWFAQVVFRDYRVVFGGRDAAVQVTPVSEPIVACRGREVSIPILSRDGSMLAGRDEATATTKLFRLQGAGECEELLDLGIQTGKVAFGPHGRRIAFAVPQGALHDGRRVLGIVDEPPRELEGVFVLDLHDLRVTRIAGSEVANRLTFPEFIGRDSVMFVVSDAEGDRFRLVCCIN